MTEKLDLDRLQALAEAATPGPWTRGDRWHIQGASHCACRPQHGPLVEERRMRINGEMMLAHVHEMPQPWWDHGIYTRERQEDGFAWNVVNDTDEYGYMADVDADFIAAANPATVLALIALARRAEEAHTPAVKGDAKLPQNSDTPESGELLDVSGRRGNEMEHTNHTDRSAT